MTRVSRLLARLLAAILLLQVAGAPAHGLAMAAPGGLATVICSAEGMRTMHLGPDGQELPAPDSTRGFCPACAAVPQLLPPDPPRLAGPAWAEAGRPWHAAAAQDLPPPAHGPPFASRAPPAFA